MPLHRRKPALTLLAACFFIALFAAAYPMYVIRPFRAQGPNELAIALVVRRWAPLVCSVAAVTGIIAAIFSWKTSRGIFSRLAVLGAGVLTVVFSAFSYVNVFEIMFHRIDSPEAVPASEAKLDTDDMVVAIHPGGHARAYPIRMMAYHHIVNDWVGGVPVVSTY